MSQNIYDNQGFFEGYSRLPRSVGGLDAAPEWPALRALLPDLQGLRVLDLGCGYGWFCRFARESGAASVLGTDLSGKMLERAREMTSDPAIAYRRADLETLTLEAGTFDLVYSSLTLHYLVQLERLIAEMHRALPPGGRFIFSAEHPIFTAPSRPGWTAGDATRPAWQLDGYLDEGPRSTDWLAKGVIKQHRTVATYINLLIEGGFRLLHVEEWGPTTEQIAAHPEWAVERDRPPFLLVAAAKV